VRRLNSSRPSLALKVGALLGSLLLGGAGALYWHSHDLDLLVVGGLVVDGTGGAPYRADVAVRDGRIVGVSRWRYFFARPRTRLNAAGKVVAPGFIDVHTHVEANLPRGGAFRPENFLRQGVTTLITGNCGRSRTDVAEMLQALEKHGTFINVVTLVGHNSVRRAVMGQAARAPSDDELRQMRLMVERAMEGGAFGLSTGLAYAPGRFARTDEVIALARTAAERGGVYASHIRDEAHGGEEALREALSIGRVAGAVTQISHLKCSGRAAWHSMRRRLALLDEAREAGLRVYADVYPYDRSSTTTDILLPDWAIAEKRAGLRRAAQDAQAGQQLRADIRDKLRADGWVDLRHVRLVAGKPEWVGRTLAEVPVVAATCDEQVENLIAISLRGGAQAIYADMHADDVALALAYPFGVFGSDSAVRDPEADYRPHPRGTGTFPRLLRPDVREASHLELSEAVRKASRLAAEIFGLAGRGQLRGGYWADLVIFDPERIADEADYDQPFAEPVGIDYVIVNGVVVVARGSFADAPPPGRALRNPAASLTPLAGRGQE
jgi:N-acyl-D-amino-acid deacylase